MSTCGGMTCTRPRRSARGERDGICARPGRRIMLTERLSLDYIFQLAVEMHKMSIPWISEVARVGPDRDY